MPSSRFRFLTFFGVTLLAGVLLSPLMGCDEGVIGVLGTEQPYTLYGVINPRSDTQWVRVFPVQGRLAPRDAVPLDAAFRSVNLQTEETRVWQDSIIREPSGLYEHVFWSPFRATYGQSYRIEVVRSDDATSHVETEVPQDARLRLQEPITRFGVSQAVLVEGNVPRLLRVEVIYSVDLLRPGTVDKFASEAISLPYSETTARTDGGWTISIDLSEARQTLVAQLRQAYAAPALDLRLLVMDLRLIVANEEWNPPGGVFDPNLLVQPGVLDNVENGFGFVGAGYRLRRQWKPTNDVLEEAGFSQQTDTSGSGPSSWHPPQSGDSLAVPDWIVNVE
ncbi:MAG: hypothetical protein ACR2GR_02110 [Rhodothermales bacterium]